jgi:hypothetical protein
VTDQAEAAARIAASGPTAPEANGARAPAERAETGRAVVNGADTEGRVGMVATAGIAANGADMVGRVGMAVTGGVAVTGGGDLGATGLGSGRLLRRRSGLPALMHRGWLRLSC